MLRTCYTISMTTSEYPMANIDDICCLWAVGYVFVALFDISYMFEGTVSGIPCLDVKRIPCSDGLSGDLIESNSRYSFLG